VVLVGSDQLYVAKNWFRRPRVVVAVGDPIPAPLDREDRKEWAEKLAGAMRALYVDVKKKYALEAVVLPKTPQERWRDGR
jgi:1-acyl-sn-glycerol-3-phosphate acyltransferase